MNSLIKETNDNLRAIIDTLKGNLDSYVSALDGIQIQMDKKVEEAKSYKTQVDSAKQLIKDLENDNKSLELSLKELNEKYGKLNLVSVIEAGNVEIKAKINDNIREINKQKENIAELTGKARMIKDLLLNLKKDKTIKEEKLANIEIVYDYYNSRVNSIIDYSFNHSENLADYKNSSINFETNDEIDAKDLENTMVFDEIANIDENKILKDEMSYISEQIDNDLEDINFEDTVDEIDEEPVDIDIDALDSTQIFNSIVNPDVSIDEVVDNDDLVEEDENDDDVVSDDSEGNTLIPENEGTELEEEMISSETTKEDFIDFNEKIDLESFKVEEPTTDEISINEVVSEEQYLDDVNEERLDKINNLFSTLNNIDLTEINNDNNKPNILDTKIDTAFRESFEQPIEEEIKVDPTLLDIFGNPIEKDEISQEVEEKKKIEELFVANGIDFNKFKEDEQNYLKEIYDEDKFKNIFETLKRNKINIDNVYKAFNIFGEISANELENLISKLIMNGQSTEAIGLVLEKLPRVKKYKLDEAIMSYGDYVKDVDITELIMKAKELYNNGGNL